MTSTQGPMLTVLVVLALAALTLLVLPRLRAWADVADLDAAEREVDRD